MKTTAASPAMAGTNPISISPIQHDFFKAGSPAPDDIIDPHSELEIKRVLSFADKNDAHTFAEKHALGYPSEFILKALVAEGFDVREDVDPKNLSSHYFDLPEETLRRNFVSLRVRYNEEQRRKRLNPNIIQINDADMSFKLSPGSGMNGARMEYEARIPHTIDPETGQPVFDLSFAPLVARYVEEIHEQSGKPEDVMKWVNLAWECFQFDMARFREFFSINCRRSKPYVVLYTLKNAEGDFVRDAKTGEIIVHKRKPDILPEGTECRSIVWQLCLDTNRYFAPAPDNPGESIMIGHDCELECELQTKKDEYQVNALASSAGVTHEEADATYAYIKATMDAACVKHKVDTCPERSGLSKQERGFIYRDRYNEKNPEAPLTLADRLTIRGQASMARAQSHSWDEMLAQVPLLDIISRALRQRSGPSKAPAGPQ